MPATTLPADTWTQIADTGGKMLLFANVTSVHVHTGVAPSGLGDAFILPQGKAMEISAGVSVFANPGAVASSCVSMLV